MRRFFIIFSLSFILLVNLIFADIIPEISKSSLEFGVVASCKKPTDTVVVKNPSGSQSNFKLLVGEKITGSDVQNFKIVNPKIKDLDLPPYDGSNAVIYVVEFEPSIGVSGFKQATLEIPTDLPNYPTISIPLSGTSEILQYIINPPQIDFGDIATNTNYQKSIDIEVILDSLSAKYISINNSQSNLTFSTTPTDSLFTPQNPKKTIALNINLPNIGSFSDQINIHITEPCDTVLSIPIKANGVGSSITTDFLDIDYGLISKCEKKDTSITLSFSGSDNGTIDSVGSLSGNLNNLLQVKFSKPLPISMNKNNPAETITFSINGDNFQSGNLDVFVPIYTTIAGQSNKLLFHLIANIQDAKLSQDQISIVFPTLLPNNNDQKTLKITNNSNFDISVDSCKFVGNFPQFFSLLPNFVSDILTISNSNNYNIVFEPKLPNISANCNLIVYYSYRGCLDSLMVNLTGNSFAKGKVDFAFSDLNSIKIDPKLNELILPITMKSEDAKMFLQDTVICELSFPRSVFYPLTIKNTTLAQIISNTINNNNRIIQIANYINTTLDSLNNYLFAEIQGIPLLGDTKTGTFNLQNIKFLNHSDLFDVGNITNLPFELQVCTAGGDRLLTFANEGNPGIVKISTLGNEGQIQFLALEKGENQIFIYDYTGNIVFLTNFVSQSNELVQIPLKLSNLPTGVYFIRIKTLSNTYSNKFLKN
jgi:hypothetical protein